jgi:fused signal recognition particle receptor
MSVAKKGLGARIRQLLQGGREGEAFYDELEDILIEGDIGAATAMTVVGELREEIGLRKMPGRDRVIELLKPRLKDYLKAEALRLDPNKLNCVLVLGVNGVGKTTTIAKLVDYYERTQGFTNIVLAAADTFRAGAIEQLKVHGERLGVRVVGQAPGADPGAVIYDAITSARAHGNGLVIADTAGRMHNKANLVKELQKIDKVARGRIGDGIYRTLLVIDGTTGQNGLRQAEVFNEAVGVSSVVLTKYDSTAKGGIALSICKNLGLPFSFIGTGEKPGDLEPFDPDSFLDSLLML